MIRIINKKLFIFIGIIISLFMLSGCQNQTINDNEYNIVTSFYPIYIATSNVADGVDGVKVINLTAQTTGCLHDYQIQTSDMVKLSHADVLVINGDGMENFIDKAISTYENLKIVDSSEGIKEKYPEIVKDSENNHYWMSITLYEEQVRNIANDLAKYDSKNAEKYLFNAENYIKKLDLLKAEMHTKVSKLNSKNIVTFHEAFEFFANEFDLNVVAVIEREPGTYPSCRDVAEIIDLVREDDVKVIYTEPQYSQNAANTIARETGAVVATLDPIVTGELNKDAYETLMRQNLESLEKTLK